MKSRKDKTNTTTSTTTKNTHIKNNKNQYTEEKKAHCYKSKEHFNNYPFELKDQKEQLNKTKAYYLKSKHN
jgi:hypothetical protein